MPSDPSVLAKLLASFSGRDLTLALSTIEASAEGVGADECGRFLSESGAAQEVLRAAGMLKRLAAQINVVIHALGILRCLPHILGAGERVEYLSLGAGNTGREFDLETSHRIAEFKFIDWKGGPESIRQNGIFKDFFLLAESGTSKRKDLYVLGDEHPLKFLNGGRALASVLSKDEKIRRLFYGKFGDEMRTVRDYYRPRRDLVNIIDVSPWLPELKEKGSATDAGL